MRVLRPLMFTNVACDLVAHTADLQNWLTNMNAVPDLLAGQHTIRIWEYAMTMRNIYAWKALQPHKRFSAGLHIADVGGASSNFWKLLKHYKVGQVTCIDPAYTLSEVEDAKEQGRRVHALPIADAIVDIPYTRGSFDVVTCISVIEHVKVYALAGFLADLTMLLKPGGLLCLTTDFAPPPDPILVAPKSDTYHFHWMREQIFDAEELITQVLDPLARLGYNLLGASDLAWKGEQVYDYSMVSAALVYQPKGTE